MNISSFNPMMMQQKMQERFDAADSDQSGGITLAEMQQAAPEDANVERMEEMFARMDSDGDGTVTQQEHDQHFETMAQRMNTYEFGAGQGQGYGSSDGLGSSVSTLLQSLAQDPELSDEQQAQIEQALSELETGGNPKSLTSALDLLESIVPSINTVA